MEKRWDTNQSLVRIQAYTLLIFFVHVIKGGNIMTYEVQFKLGDYDWQTYRICMDVDNAAKLMDRLEQSILHRTPIHYEYCSNGIFTKGTCYPENILQDGDKFKVRIVGY